MNLYLVHHGDAVGPNVDARRPLSAIGRRQVDQLSAEAALRGVCPAVVWHSGKLRARQTAEAFWRSCNALADFEATRDLQPEDQPSRMWNRLKGETRDVLIAGHFPHLPKLLAMLLGSTGSGPGFPPHGVVALASGAEGGWREEWRMETPGNLEIG